MAAAGLPPAWHHLGWGDCSRTPAPVGGLEAGCGVAGSPAGFRVAAALLGLLSREFVCCVAVGPYPPPCLGLRLPQLAIVAITSSLSWWWWGTSFSGVRVAVGVWAVARRADGAVGAWTGAGRTGPPWRRRTGLVRSGGPFGRTQFTGGGVPWARAACRVPVVLRDWWRGRSRLWCRGFS